MSENSNLPAVISRFGEALEITNTRKRAAAVERIFEGIRSQIQAATEEHALILNQANTCRRQATDALAKYAHHASATDLAIRQGDRDAAIRQGRERERWAATAKHAEAEAQQYTELARVQSGRMQDLKDLDAELLTAYKTMEREAISAYIAVEYQRALVVHQQWRQDLEAARAHIDSAQVEATVLAARSRVDPGFESTLLEMEARSRALADEIDRKFQRANG
jgi:hypothetical protein